MKVSVSALESERAQLTERLAALEAERAQLAAALTAAQAQAVRSGDFSVAAQQERRRAELAVEAERLNAALTTIEADLQAAREAQLLAERVRQEHRLQRIYDDAGKLADALQASPADRASWDKLCALYAEHAELRRALYGVDVLARPGRSNKWDWEHPRKAWRAYWTGIDRLAFGTADHADEADFLHQHGLRVAPSPHSLRAALGL